LSDFEWDGREEAVVGTPRLWHGILYGGGRRRFLENAQEKVAAQAGFRFLNGSGDFYGESI